MRTRCEPLYDGDLHPACGEFYDDARQWTICPRMPLEGPVQPHSENPGHGYCRQHDLFGCPLHEESITTQDMYGICKPSKKET